MRQRSTDQIEMCGTFRLPGNARVLFVLSLLLNAWLLVWFVDDAPRSDYDGESSVDEDNMSSGIAAKLSDPVTVKVTKGDPTAPDGNAPYHDRVDVAIPLGTVHQNSNLLNPDRSLSDKALGILGDVSPHQKRALEDAIDKTYYSIQRLETHLVRHERKDGEHIIVLPAFPEQHDEIVDALIIEFRAILGSTMAEGLARLVVHERPLAAGTLNVSFELVLPEHRQFYEILASYSEDGKESDFQWGFVSDRKSSIESFGERYRHLELFRDSIDAWTKETSED